MTRKGRKILNLFKPAALRAIYSESLDIRERQNIVEKKIEIGTAMRTSVVITLPIRLIIKPMPISSEAMSVMIRKSSKVIRKETKKVVLKRKGKIKFDAM